MFDYGLMHYLLIFGTIAFLLVMPLALFVWIKRQVSEETAKEITP